MLQLQARLQAHSLLLLLLQAHSLLLLLQLQDHLLVQLPAIRCFASCILTSIPPLNPR